MTFEKMIKLLVVFSQVFFVTACKLQGQLVDPAISILRLKPGLEAQAELSRKTISKGSKIDLKISVAEAQKDDSFFKISMINSDGQESAKMIKFSPDVFISAGDLFVQTSIFVFEDNMYSGDETIKIKISSDNGVVVNSAGLEFKILETQSKPIPEFTLSASSFKENDDSTKVISAKLNKISLTPYKVKLEVDASSTADLSALKIPSEITFSPLETQTQITFQYLDDSIFNKSRKLVLRMPEVDNTYVNQISLKIVDNENDCDYSLDQYSQVSFALSLRKLYADFNGPLVRLKRQADGFELDFGVQEGACSVSSNEISNFAQGGDVFVVKWYDQSGHGRNAAALSGSSLPLIVEKGTVSLFDNKLGLKFDGKSVLAVGDHAIDLNKSFAFSLITKIVSFVPGSNLSGDGTYFIDREADSSGLYSLKMCTLSTSTNGITDLGVSSQRRTAAVGAEVSSQVSSLSNFQSRISSYFSQRRPGLDSSLYYNETTKSVQSEVVGDYGFKKVYIGRHAVNVSTGTEIGISELIYFSDELSDSERQSLYNSQKVYYGIP